MEREPCRPRRIQAKAQGRSPVRDKLETWMPTDLPEARAYRKPGTLELDPSSGEGVATDETPG